jgi:hypothetical protein
MCLAWLLFIQYVESALFTVTTGPGGCGVPVTVTANLKTDSSSPIQGADVTITSNFQTFSGLTDVSGSYATQFNYDTENTYAITATYRNGSAIFATWSTDGLGTYTGTLPGELTITVTGDTFTPFDLTSADFSDATTYKYPGPASGTAAIEFASDDPWEMFMTPSTENLLLYMDNWDVDTKYTFSSAFSLISPLNLDAPANPALVLQLSQSPYYISTPTFSGLLRFTENLNELDVSTQAGANFISQIMTLALAPLEGQVQTSTQITCCVPQNPTLAYTDSLFVPNLWVWSPSVKLMVGTTPLAGKQITLSVNDLSTGIPSAIFATCTATTDINGVAKCVLATSLTGRTKVSLNAQFGAVTCTYTAVSISKQLTVFGFPDNGQHAFIVSNNTGNAAVGSKVVFSGIDWFQHNSFGAGDARSQSGINVLTQLFLANIGFGGYVKSNLQSPTCHGTFSWLSSFLTAQPTTLPTNMGILVADKLGANGIFDGTWSKIIVLSNLNYKPKALGKPGYGYMLGTFCPTQANIFLASLPQATDPPALPTPTPKPPTSHPTPHPTPAPTPKHTTKHPTPTPKKKKKGQKNT